MKVYLLKLLSFFDWRMAGVHKCENCQSLSLNDLKIEDEYLGFGCVKEKQYYYCPCGSGKKYKKCYGANEQ